MATPMKRKFNCSSSSESGVSPIAKRINDLQTDSSAVSTRLVIDTSYESTGSGDGPSPANSTPRRDEGDWVRVGSSPKQSKGKVEGGTWLFVTLMTVATAFPMDKAAMVVRVLTACVGSDFIKPEGKGKNCLFFKIRADKINALNSFRFGNFDFRHIIQSRPKPLTSRGIINIPEGQNFDDFQKTIKIKHPEV